MTVPRYFEKLLAIMWHKSAFQILSLLYGASLLVLLFLLYNYVQNKNQMVPAAQELVRQETRVVVQQINNKLSQLESIAHALADDLSTGKLARSQIRGKLKQAMDKVPHMFGIGVAYVPYVNDPQTRRNSLYYINRLGTLQIEQEDLLQIFTVPCSYIDPTTKTTISKGVVFIDYYLTDIKALMTSLNLGKTDYGFILSKQGVFISHPIEDYVKSRKTIFNIAESRNDRNLKRLGEQAINNESGVIDYFDKVTGQHYWIFYQPIEATGWVMGVVVLKNEFLAEGFKALRHKQIWIGFWFIVSMVFFFTLLFRNYQGEGFWQTAFSSSIFLLVGIGIIWYLAQTTSFHPRGGNTIIADKASLNTFLSSNTTNKQQPILVPTGVLIESLEFSGTYNIKLIGYIWQKYDDYIHTHKGLSRGFILPEADSMKITEVYRDKAMIKWYFEAYLRQQFDYSRYPFDIREINLFINHQDVNKNVGQKPDLKAIQWLNIHNKDVNKNVILTPDLEAYQWLNINERPGVKPNLLLPGWHIKTSFFNYRVGKQHFPKLYFTVVVQRDFLTPSIKNLLSLIVLIVVGGMLFAILLLLGKVKSFANVIAPLAALFLGTILAHIGLRKEIPTWKIIYIDYFYIVMYLAFLAVIVSYFLFHNTKSNLFFIQYRHGLVAKLLFWPLILGSLLGITVWKFYNN